MSTEAATPDEARESIPVRAQRWAAEERAAGRYLDVHEFDLGRAKARSISTGRSVEEALADISAAEAFYAAEKRRRDEEVERVRVAFEIEPAAPEVAPYDEEIDAADREHEIARDAYLTARCDGDETDVIVLRVRAHESYRALKRAKYKRAAARGVYTSSVTEWIRRDELDRHANRVRELMLSVLLSDEIARRYDEAPTFSAVVFAYRDAATKLRDELERQRGRSSHDTRRSLGAEATRAQASALFNEHRGATRAIRPCASRVRLARRTCTSSREGPDGGGEPPPEPEQPHITRGSPRPAHARNSASTPTPETGRTDEVCSAPRIIRKTDPPSCPAARDCPSTLTGDLRRGRNHHQAAHVARLTHESTTPHRAPIRSAYRLGQPRRVVADAKTKRLSGGDPRGVTQTAERAESGPDTRILRAFWPAEKGEPRALCAGRVRAQ